MQSFLKINIQVEFEERYKSNTWPALWKGVLNYRHLTWISKKIPSLL